MTSKQVYLAPDLKFDSITSARLYFRNVLNSTNLNEYVSKDECRNLTRLYEVYCRGTDWPISSPPVAFYPMDEKGPGYTTKCFGVEFADGTRQRFSLDRALTIAAKSKL
jgi:hypothetical protein